MTITETHMGTGSFTIKLKEETPLSVLDAIPKFGVLAVTPARIPITTLGTSQDSILDSSSYGGIIFGDSNRRMTVRGFGWPSMLGMSDGLSDLIETAFTTSAKTVLQHVQGSILRNQPVSAWYMNGVSEGSITASATTKAFDVPFGFSPYDFLELVRNAFGMEWRINPNGSLDIDTAANLFVPASSATVLIHRRGGRSSDGSYYAYIDPESDVEGWTERYVLKPTSGSNGAANIGTNPYYGFDGENLERERAEESSTVNNATDAGTVATNKLATLDDVRREINIEIDAYDPRFDLEPGDHLYVFDLESGLYDTDNQIMHRGELIFPLDVRIKEMTWPVQQGMGVYARSSDGNGTWQDLSDYFEAETGTTSLVVGHPHWVLSVL